MYPKLLPYVGFVAQRGISSCYGINEARDRVYPSANPSTRVWNSKGMPCRVSEQIMSVVDESSIGVSIPSAAMGSLSDAPPVNEDGGDAEATTPVVVVEELPEETPVSP